MKNEQLYCLLCRAGESRKVAALPDIMCTYVTAALLLSQAHTNEVRLAVVCVAGLRQHCQLCGM